MLGKASLAAKTGAGSSGGPPKAADAVNGHILEKVMAAVTFLTELPAFGDIHAVGPGHISEGTPQHAPLFTATHCVAALKGVGSYLAGGNIFWLDLAFNLQAGIPTSASSIDLLREQFFQSPPTVFPEKVTVGLLTTECPSKSFGKLVRISPEEIVYAFLLAAEKDIKEHTGDDERALKRRACALATPIEFVVCSNIDDRFWRSVDLRETIGAVFASMYRSAVQRISELVGWKAQQEEKTNVSMGAAAVAEAWAANVRVSSMGEKITVGFVDSALTVWDRLLADPVCRQLIMQTEDHWGKRTPWDSVYKLEAVIKKRGRPGEVALGNLRWSLSAVTDTILNETSVPQFFTVRMLQGKGQPGNKGILDLRLYKKHIRQHLSLIHI